MDMEVMKMLAGALAALFAVLLLAPLFRKRSR